MSEADKIIKNLKNSGKKVEEFYVSNKTSDKNVVTEEDIRVINKIISFYKDIDILYNKEIQALERVLAEREQMLKEKQDDKKDIIDFQNALNEENLRCANYAIENNELKKRIQELEEQVKTLDEAYTGTIKESKKWFDIAHNSIPKQVVIDEVKRLKNILKATTEGILQKYTVEEIIIKINTFEELLEDMENGRK